MEGAVAIYKEKYWNVLSLDQIDSMRVRWKVFDIGVNLGPKKAAKFLQTAVGATVDGTVGIVTRSLTNAQTADNVGEIVVVEYLVELQMKYYISKVKESPVKIKYLSGWANRAFDWGESFPLMQV